MTRPVIQADTARQIVALQVASTVMQHDHLLALQLLLVGDNDKMSSATAIYTVSQKTSPTFLTVS